MEEQLNLNSRAVQYDVAIQASIPMLPTQNSDKQEVGGGTKKERRWESLNAEREEKIKRTQGGNCHKMNTE